MKKYSTEAWGIGLIRMVVGGIFLAHGLQKALVFGLAGVAAVMGDIGLPWPAASAVAVTATELFGGLALALGFFTRLAAVPLAFAMLVASVTVHLPQGFFLPNGAEYALMMLAATVGLALTGSGAFAIDNLIGRSREAATRPAVPRAA